MFDFGIQGYRTQWLEGFTAVRATHGERLAELAGCTLRHVWLAWDLDDDRWVSDWPVLLDFGVEQVEINHKGTDDMSITFDSIDVDRPLDDDLDIAWRHEPLPQLRLLLAQQVRQIQLIGGLDPATGYEPVAVSFTFRTGHLVVYNHRDDNGLSFEPPDRK